MLSKSIQQEASTTSYWTLRLNDANVNNNQEIQSSWYWLIVTAAQGVWVSVCAPTAVANIHFRICPKTGEHHQHHHHHHHLALIAWCSLMEATGERVPVIAIYLGAHSIVYSEIQHFILIWLPS